MRRFAILSMCLVVVMLFVAPAQAEIFKVYYLGGQSNMGGYGQVSQLPEELKAQANGVMIFHGNTMPDGQAVDGRGIWSELKPGHGVGFRSDGTENKYSDRFGVELTFAQRLKELDPDANIALIKYSRSGTSIAIEAARQFGCWDPDFIGGEGAGAGVNQYDHLLATIRQAMAVTDIDGDGEKDTLMPSGIIWMQGESDAAHSEKIARAYENNLKRLMDLIRAALRQDDLPVAVGRISDSGKDGDGKVWDHGEIVRGAQAAFVRKDGYATLVTSTDKYSYSDKWHYESAGYIDLGRQFADALVKITAR